MNAPESRDLTVPLLLTTAITGALAFLQVYAIQSVLPVLMRDLHIDAVAAGGLVGATVLAVAVISPFIGMLSDAWGRKWLITAAVCFLALPTAGMFWTHSAEQMWWLRFLQGLAVPGITVVLIAYVSEEFDGAQRVRLMSFYVAGTILGGFLGRFLMGYLNEWMGWRHGLLLMAALNVAGAVLVWRQLPASRRFVAQPRVRQALVMLWRHLRNRHVLSACALGFCVLFSLLGCFTYINLYLAAPPYRLNSAQLADIFAVYLIGMLITPLAGRLIVRFGPSRTMLLAVALSVFGMLLSLSPPLGVVILALAMMSSGVFITQSATINYIAQHVTEGRSLASGIYYMAYYAGGSAGAWLCGFAYAQGGWVSTVSLLVAVQVVAMLIAGVLMGGRRLPV